MCRSSVDGFNWSWSMSSVCTSTDHWGFSLLNVNLPVILLDPPSVVRVLACGRSYLSLLCVPRQGQHFQSIFLAFLSLFFPVRGQGDVTLLHHQGDGAGDVPPCVCHPSSVLAENPLWEEVCKKLRVKLRTGHIYVGPVLSWKWNVEFTCSRDSYWPDSRYLYSANSRMNLMLSPWDGEFGDLIPGFCFLLHRHLA